jgi:hypothetical protein
MQSEENGVPVEPQLSSFGVADVCTSLHVGDVKEL